MTDRVDDEPEEDDGPLFGDEFDDANDGELDPEDEPGPHLDSSWSSNHGDVSEPSRTQKRRLGPALLGVGGSIWALVAVMRCAAPQTDPPSLAVEPAEADAPAESSQPRPTSNRTDDSPSEPASSPPAQVDEMRTPPPVPDSADPAQPAPPAPRPAPAPWVAQLQAPQIVHYTIRRGGSAKNVANLFKIFHHEIRELNPGIDIERELPPNTELVVYRRDGDPVSESVGYPSNGSLVGGVPMVEGPGRALKAIPWKSFATAKTIAIVDYILRDWADRGHRQPILVGNMAAREGGRLPPHSTHQSGRDVDLGYPQKLADGAELNWANMTEDNLDAASTWELLLSLARSGTVEVIYVDRTIQKLLYEHALDAELMPKSKLRAWMEYPKATGSGNPLVQHVSGHIDHLHVRFRCQPHEKKCKSRS